LQRIKKNNMSKKIKMKYYLNDNPVSRKSINWDNEYKLKIVGDSVYITTVTNGQLATRHKAVSKDNFHPEKLENESFITVTVVTSYLKEDIAAKLLDASSKSQIKSSKKDSSGNTLRFYEELGIKPPKDFDEDVEKSQFRIKKTDYRLDEKLAKIRPELIEFMVDNEDFGSSLYVGKDFIISVKESVSEVESKIKKIKNVVK
jgi:hypothetical protein